jgi:hypothetical protein
MVVRGKFKDVSPDHGFEDAMSTDAVSYWAQRGT